MSGPDEVTQPITWLLYWLTIEVLVLAFMGALIWTLSFLADQRREKRRREQIRRILGTPLPPPRKLDDPR